MMTEANNVSRGNSGGAEKIVICHATAAGHYNRIEVSKRSIISPGHGDSGINVGDIIPPFDDYDGNNWEEGQAIWENDCIIPNGTPDDPEDVTIHASKIICEYEDYLPNMSGGDDITEDTAIEWLAEGDNSEHCWLDENWEFQWKAGGIQTSDTEDNDGELLNWNTFSVDNPAQISESELSGSDTISVREVMYEGYIPFSGESSTGASYSAEFYCADDVMNYDNLEWIQDVALGESYYCIAFNAPETTDIEVCKENEEGDKLGGWEIFLDYKETDLRFEGFTEENDGCFTFENIPYGDYELSETLQPGWENISGLGDITVDNDSDYFTVVNSKNSFTINAYKVMCEEESDFPEWVKDADYPSMLTEELIMDYVENSADACWFESGWEFEWAGKTVPDPGGEHIGYGGADWNSFGPTDENGLAMARIDFEDIVWVREVLQEGYLAFSDEPGGDYSESAELICHIDGFNYDNYERVDDPIFGEDYYCAAFNTLIEDPEPKATIFAHKVVCEDESHLPDWGDTPEGEIDETTAIDFVSENSEYCRLESNWQFEWGYDGEVDKKPGDFTGPAGGNWHAFDTVTGSTPEEPAKAYITDLKTSDIWVREILKDGYLPFSSSGSEIGDSYSAEFYCHQDVYKYDNFDRVEGIELENEYYCVGFNVLEEPEPNTATIRAHKVICEDETDLPNWVNDRSYPGPGDPLTEQRVIDYVTNSEGRCRFTENGEDWSFQWGYDGEVDEKPGDFTGPADGNWHAFESKAMGTNPALATISLENGENVRVREVLQEGYLAFSDEPGGDYSESAELICHTDGYNYDNYEYIDGMEDGESYICVAFNIPVSSEVEVCKKGDMEIYLEGWEVALVADEPLQEPVLINVENETGTDSITLDEGYYLIKVSGTYRYGNEEMIADAGYSKRPDGEWVSGFDLPSGKGLMALIDGETVYWGPFNENYHEYTTIYHHEEEGVVNISIWDDNYPDNLNNGEFSFSIYEVYFRGITECDGCVTFSNVPFGTHLLEEWNQEGWEIESGVGPIVVDQVEMTFTIVNSYYDDNRQDENERIPQENNETADPSRSGNRQTVSLLTTQTEEEPAEEEPDGEVAGAVTEDDGQEEAMVETCGIYLNEFLRYGTENNPEEVKKLQVFLNEHMGENLWVDGYFGIETFEAVERFQLEYKEEVLRPWVEAGIHNDENIPTGYVFETTRRWINMIMCPELGLDMPDLSIYFREISEAEVTLPAWEWIRDEEVVQEPAEEEPDGEVAGAVTEDEDNEQDEDEDPEFLAGAIDESGRINITQVLAGLLILTSLGYIGYRGVLVLQKKKALSSWSG